MPARHPYPEQKFHPKLQASTTTREGFPRHQLPPARPRTAQIAHQTPDIPIGSTTMRDDYVQWGFQPRHQTPTQHASRPTKFHGITTTRSDFPWPAKIQPPPSMYNTNRDSRPVPEFEGDTTYRQAYGKVELPRGMPADIGIQVASKPYAQGGVGGQFELMIQQRKAAPQVATKTFTTAQDGQPAVAIVVVAKRAEYSHGVILGTFTMEGIKSAPTGVPKIEVTIKLVNERTLHASALYRNGKRTKAHLPGGRQGRAAPATGGDGGRHSGRVLLRRRRIEAAAASIWACAALYVSIGGGDVGTARRDWLSARRVMTMTDRRRVRGRESESTLCTLDPTDFRSACRRAGTIRLKA